MRKKADIKVPAICIKMKQSLLNGVEKTETFESFCIPHIIKHGALPRGTEQTLLMLKTMTFKKNLRSW